MLPYLVPLILLTTSASGVLIFTSNFTTPITSEGSLVPINLVYFFVSAWISLAGTIALVLYCVRSFRLKKLRNEVGLVNKPKLLFKISLRQGILISTALTGVALLNALNFSNPLNIISLVSAIVLIEIYFFSH